MDKPPSPCSGCKFAQINMFNTCHCCEKTHKRERVKLKPDGERRWPMYFDVGEVIECGLAINKTA
jgi:hypothetical protein